MACRIRGRKRKSGEKGSGAGKLKQMAKGNIFSRTIENRRGISFHHKSANTFW
jgi:hypothetical protein